MTTVIYIDVLFMINFLINYFLLHITQKILYIKTTKLKKIVAASIGGVYSCLMFFPEVSGLYTFYFKVIFSLIITYAAFPIRKIRLFLKAVAVFYIASFLMCGVTFAILFIAKGLGGGVGETNNGVFYFHLNWTVLVWAVGVCFATVKIINSILISSRGTIYKEVKINYLDKTVTLDGIIDTGNRLSDPMSKSPVIVCEMEALEGLFDEKMKEFFKKSTIELSDGDLKDLCGIRLIPFNSIGKQGGIIKGFVCDSIEIDNKLYPKITVAVHNGNFSSDMNYKVLLGARFL